MNRIVHFEIPADRPERAIDFYKKIFGWKIEKWGEGEEDYWLIDTGKTGMGINGGLMESQDNFKKGAFYCTVDVKDLDDALERVKENGGKVIKEKMAIPKMGWLAYCEDTEKNIFGMMQEDKDAA